MKLGPEHLLQIWCDRFIDRAVTPPMFVTGIDTAAKDMANEARRFTLQARGVKFGVPDVLVCQLDGAIRRLVWIELKVDAPVTERQAATHRAMRAAGQSVFVCRSVHDVLAALRDEGFDLHGNADNLATEYQARAEAERPAKPRSNKPRAPRKPAKARRTGMTSTALMTGRLV